MRQPLWQRAASFAARKHEHAHRDDGQTPYFSHPTRVAMAVSALFGCQDDEALAAAYLHDVIENTDTSFDDLQEEFGERIAGLVSALTKTTLLPGKEAEREYLERLSKADWRARLVKLADQLDNYTDVLAGVKEDSGEEIKKCRRILELARADAKKHDETKRALAALRKVCAARRVR
jgi:(p)ppGpp synthase/HD superfamily hydrolase